jgi:3',5'-cyclic AMP phosphodiesterase CpdA
MARGAAMKIALISDTHLAPIANAFQMNCDAARAWIEAARCDLLVHLGDITADAAKDPSHFITASSAFTSWNGPIRFVPGNHDIGDNPAETAESRETAVSRERLALYRQAFGPDYWSLDCENDWTLIALNAQIFGFGGAEEAAQFDWLAAELELCTGPVGLMLHKPLFRDGPEDCEKHHRYVPTPARRRLLELLAGCDLRFVVSGHTHQTRRFHANGVEHVWAPSAAFFIPDRLQERIGEKIVGMMVVTLSENGHSFELVIPPGLMQLDISDHVYVYPDLIAGSQRLPAPQA